jgi:hypothetical protein
MSDDELLEMAHTIMLRMAMRGGFDSYTGARLHEWLRRYDARPTQRAPDLAKAHDEKCRCVLCRMTDVLNHPAPPSG